MSKVAEDNLMRGSSLRRLGAACSEATSILGLATAMPLFAPTQLYCARLFPIVPYHRVLRRLWVYFCPPPTPVSWCIVAPEDSGSRVSHAGLSCAPRSEYWETSSPPYIHLHPPFPPLSCRYGKARAQVTVQQGGSWWGQSVLKESRWGGGGKILHPTVWEFWITF